MSYVIRSHISSQLGIHTSNSSSKMKTDWHAKKYIFRLWILIARKNTTAENTKIIISSLVVSSMERWSTVCNPLFWTQSWESIDNEISKSHGTHIASQDLNLTQLECAVFNHYLVICLYADVNLQYKSCTTCSFLNLDRGRKAQQVFLEMG